VYYWKKYIREIEVAGKTASEKMDFSGGAQTPEMERSKLVFFDRKKQFELEDLLRASAEMLGKGSFGTAYKAVLDDGCVVAVKRLKDVNPSGKKEFDQHMELIGKLRHPHIVRLRAYYYAKEEKLLVYDYLPNGSLYSLLHGQWILCLVSLSFCLVFACLSLMFCLLLTTKIRLINKSAQTHINYDKYSIWPFVCKLIYSSSSFIIHVDIKPMIHGPFM